MKTLKKIGISLLCAWSVVLGALGMVACGSTGNKTQGKPEVKPQGVATVAQLRGISNGAYALENDIDLQGEEWTPLASFSGTLDGKGYRIYNFQLQQSQDNLGFIAQNSGTVKNVIFENVTLTVRGDKSSAGIVAGKNTGTIDHCTVNGTVDASYCKWVGGIVGHNANGKIKNCENNATVTAGDIIGGIVGYSQGAVEDCQNNAVISGNKCVGGIAGVVNGTCEQVINTAQIHAVEAECGGIFGAVENGCGQLQDLQNNGKVVCEGAYAGGIIGRMWSSNSAEDVENTGTVKGTDSVGGMIGACENTINIVAYKNTVSVTGAYNVGGIVGWAKDGCVLTGCENGGAIMAECYQGGIVGGGFATVVNGKNTGLLVHADGKIIEGVLFSYLGGIAGQCKSVENCTNVATVWGVGECVGGFAGMTDSATKCENTVYVTGTNQVGGIAGKGNKANDVSNSGQIEGTNNVGGIYGYVSGPYTVEACVNEGEIKGSDNVGGIVGRTDEGATFVGNENKGSVTAMGKVGGIFGSLYKATVRGNVNVGTVTGEVEIGGIVGYAYAPTMNLCENKGIINGSNNVGGLIGVADGNVRAGNYNSNHRELVAVNDCKNSGTVNGSAYVGGVFGKLTMKVGSPSISETVDVTLEKLVNIGSVTARNRVGGICANMEGAYGDGRYNYKIKTVTVYYHLHNCTNSAIITGSEYLGGIVGELGNYAVIEDTCIDNGTVKEI